MIALDDPGVAQDVWMILPAPSRSSSGTSLDAIGTLEYYIKVFQIIRNLRVDREYVA